MYKKLFISIDILLQELLSNLRYPYSNEGKLSWLDDEKAENPKKSYYRNLISRLDFVYEKAKGTDRNLSLHLTRYLEQLYSSFSTRSKARILKVRSCISALYRSKSKPDAIRNSPKIAQSMSNEETLVCVRRDLECPSGQACTLTAPY